MENQKLEIARRIIKSKAFNELDLIKQIKLLKLINQKSGIDLKTVYEIRNEKNKFVTPEQALAQGLTITSLRSLSDASDSKTKLEANNITLYPKMLRWIGDNVHLLIPTDRALIEFQKRTGIKFDFQLYLGRDRDATLLVSALTIPFKGELVPGTNYETVYGNELFYSGDRFDGTRILGKDQYGKEKYGWKIYYVDEVIIPPDLERRLLKMQNRDPKLQWFFPLDKTITDLMHRDLFQLLTSFGIKYIADPDKYLIAHGEEFDGESYWYVGENRKYKVPYKNTVVKIKNGFLDAFQEESKAYLNKLREMQNPQYEKSLEIFRQGKIMSLPEIKIFIEKMLAKPNYEVSRKELKLLFKEATLEEMINKAF